MSLSYLKSNPLLQVQSLLNGRTHPITGCTGKGICIVGKSFAYDGVCVRFPHLGEVINISANRVWTLNTRSNIEREGVPIEFGQTLQSFLEISPGSFKLLRPPSIQVVRPTPNSLMMPYEESFTRFLVEDITGVEKNTQYLPEFLSRASLTDFGLAMKSLVGGRVFIDLCCGNPRFSWHQLTTCASMGACKYIGVDQQRVTNEALEPNDLYQGLVGERRREEMLSFLKKYEPPPEGVVVFMSGIEPENPNSPASIEFQKKCCSEITRILAFGGAVIIGPATFGFKLKDAGLKLRIAGTYHAIYIP